ncbi:MAG: DUF5131 family protein [Candidatus Methylomirabilota bacterium]|jgi:protein gp37
MGKTTGIQWCDATWNPWQGCHPVSSGCAHCYMFREKRMYGQDPKTVVRSKDGTFHAPLHWKEPKRILVCSWSDFFIEEADPWRADAWAIMKACPDHTFIIPTKRMLRGSELLPWRAPIQEGLFWRDPWPNVWLLVSVSAQEESDREVQTLMETRAAVRGVNLEPLLGPVDLFGEFGHTGCSYHKPGLEWVVVGGESGGPPERALVELVSHQFNIYTKPILSSWEPKAESLAWVRSIRDQCQAAGVPFFFKQWGGPRPTSGGRLLDGREWNEFPESHTQRDMLSDVRAGAGVSAGNPASRASGAPEAAPDDSMAARGKGGQRPAVAQDGTAPR